MTFYTESINFTLFDRFSETSLAFLFVIEHAVSPSEVQCIAVHGNTMTKNHI